MRKKIVLGFIVFAVILATAFALSLQVLNNRTIVNNASLPDRPSKPELPDFAFKTGRVAEAYIFAAQNQDKVMYLACYCGCAGMQHSDTILKHKSLKDCYIKPNGSFEPHASECKLCNDITLEARDMLMTGYSLKDVRTKIDYEYSGRGAGTNTSLPP